MTVSSASEFEAVLGQCLIKIDKVLYERGDPPKLKEARRDLEKVLSFARDPKRLKEMAATLNQAAETVRVEISHDEQLRNDLWDCGDYIDFQI